MIIILSFEQLAYLLAGVLHPGRPGLEDISALFGGCKQKRLPLYLQVYLRGKRLFSWLIVGQSPQTKYSLFVYKMWVWVRDRRSSGRERRDRQRDARERREEREGVGDNERSAFLNLEPLRPSARGMYIFE